MAPDLNSVFSHSGDGHITRHVRRPKKDNLDFAATVPAGEAVASIKLINPVNFGPATMKGLMGPPIPHVTKLGTDNSYAPSFSFLIEHSSGRRLVWDLGIRKDMQNYAPKIANYIPGRGYTFQQEKDVLDILEEGGVTGESVEAVIWRQVYPLIVVYEFN
jgi:hypothetical protein